MSGSGTADEETGWARLEVLVDAGTAREIEAMVEDRGWELAEGLRLLLGSGLSYAKGERVLQAVESGAMSEDELQRTLTSMMDTETRLAVLRFRTFEAQQANQAWELSIGAIQNENQAMRAVVQRLRNENAALQAENERLRGMLPAPEAVVELQTSPPDTPAKPQPPATQSARRRFWQDWQRPFRRNSRGVNSR